jgi:RING finger and CHY zinc finger domain-containing protein 1
MSDEHHNENLRDAMERQDQAGSVPGIQEPGTRISCQHYNRGCYLLFPCCNEYYPCRFCHNEATTTHTLDPEKIHEADRKAVVRMKCKFCLEEQDISGICSKCSKIMGNYFCQICKLLDLDDKGQFHCDACGICRQGGRENFEHCDACGICFSAQKHQCMVKLDGACPICCIDMFDSTIPSIRVKCGHWMHGECFESYIEHDYRCPVCAKSLVESHAIDHFIEHRISTTPMPDEFRDRDVRILCNQCNAKHTVKYHFYGHRCLTCLSYNTRLL